MMISRFWRCGINAAGSGPKRQLHSITNKNRNINHISSRKWVGHIVLNRRRPPLLLVLDEVLRQPVMWWRMRPWCCLCVILDGKLKLSSWSKSFVALRPLFIFALCSKDQGMYMYYVCVCLCIRLLFGRFAVALVWWHSNFNFDYCFLHYDDDDGGDHFHCAALSIMKRYVFGPTAASAALPRRKTKQSHKKQ